MSLEEEENQKKKINDINSKISPQIKSKLHYSNEFQFRE